MSSIKYDASLDTRKLEAGIAQSLKSIKEWAANVERAGGQADKGIDKMNVSLKEQKQIIKDIERDVKQLQKAYDEAIAGRAKMAAGKELNAAKRALQEEKATLISLQNQQVAGNVQVEKSTEGVIGKIGRMAIAYVSVAAVARVLKETVLSFFTKSQEGIELLERKISGFKAAVGVLQGEFIKLGKSFVGDNLEAPTKWGDRITTALKLISTTANFLPGFRKWISDVKDEMNEASTVAEKYTLINQELEDAERAMIVTRAQANAEIIRARLLYADDSKPAKERIDALEKALKLENETVQEEIKHQKWTTLNLRDRNAMLEQQGRLTDENRKELQEAMAEEIKLQSESDQRQVRATNNLMTLKKELVQEDLDSKTRMERYADEFFEKERKRNQELLADKALMERYTDEYFEKEKKRDQELLADKVRMEKYTDEYFERESKNRAKYLELRTGIVGGRWSEKMQNAIAINDKEQIESLKKQLDLRDEIVNAAADLVYQIGQQIGLDEKSMTLLNAGLSAFTAIATRGAAGIPQAALAMLSGIIAQIPSAATRFEAQIEHINSLILEQSRLIEQSEQNGSQAQARKDELEYLKQLRAIQENEKKRLENKTFLLAMGLFSNKLKDINADLLETNNLIEDARDLMSEFYTDTTAASIADAISQGFQDGKTSAADFADTFNEFMIQAINSSLEEMSRPEIAMWYQKFAADMASGGGLSAEEVARLKIDWEEIIKVGKAQRDAVYSIAGISPTAGTALDKSLSMGISRSITEQTGSELTGLWRRSSDDIRNMKDYTLIGMQNLTKIESNTYNTVIELQRAIIELQAINKNTKQVPVAGF